MFKISISNFRHKEKTKVGIYFKWWYKCFVIIRHSTFCSKTRRKIRNINFNTKSPKYNHPKNKAQKPPSRKQLICLFIYEYWCIFSSKEVLCKFSFNKNSALNKVITVEDLNYFWLYFFSNYFSEAVYFQNCILINYAAAFQHPNFQHKCKY